MFSKVLKFYFPLEEVVPDTLEGLDRRWEEVGKGVEEGGGGFQ